MTCQLWLHLQALCELQALLPFMSPGPPFPSALRPPGWEWGSIYGCPCFEMLGMIVLAEGCICFDIII